MYFTPDADQIKTVKVPKGYEIKLVPSGAVENKFKDGILTKNIQDLDGAEIIDTSVSGEANVVGTLKVSGNEVVVVDDTGKISSDLLPDISITSVTVVETASTLDELVTSALAQEADGLQEGDVIVCVAGAAEGSYIVKEPVLETSDDIVNLSTFNLPEATTSTLGGVTLATGAADAIVFNSTQVTEQLSTKTTTDDVNNQIDQKITALNLAGTYSTKTEVSDVSDVANDAKTLAEAAAPQNTTYTKTEVDNKINAAQALVFSAANVLECPTDKKVTDESTVDVVNGGLIFKTTGEVYIGVSDAWVQLGVAIS